ncbi:MAG: UDP-4-amino-4,6-dideoxy-N-acetyl-beta-L-altrosamine N-acetyltransferase [Pseudomonadota bacterium]
MTVKLLDFRTAPENILQEVRNWRNDLEVAKYFVIDEISQEVHNNWLNTKIKNGSDQAFLIMNNDVAEGCVYLRNIDAKNQTAEFGIFLRPSAPQNQRLGSKAFYQILDYGFEELKLEKIYLQVFDFNDKALSLYKKFYFQIEGKLRKHVVKSGNRVDINFMGLLKEDWKNNKANLQIKND